MNALYALIAVLVLVLVSILGVQVLGLQLFFGGILPYLALLIFIVGVVYRVQKWARAPVPFRIPTTCGQQYSLPWIRSAYLDNPHTTLGVVGRMLLEVLLFRSLFRNTRTEVRPDLKRVAFSPTLWLWLAALAFHWSMAVILFRHLRLFLEPVPAVVEAVQWVDGFFQVGAPVFYVTSFGFLLALLYLLARRLFVAQLRYISLLNDYFPLFLLLGIGITGFLMRYVVKTDVVGIKEMTLGLVGFHPVVSDGVHYLFYAHLFLVCVLLAYLPFSKIMHMGGVFLSPTRNLANNNRMKRHVNPWNYPVKVHTYEEWEDEFREKMKEAGIPVEKE